MGMSDGSAIGVAACDSVAILGMSGVERPTTSGAKCGDHEATKASISASKNTRTVYSENNSRLPKCRPSLRS